MNVLILNGGRSLRMGGESKCLSFVNGKTIFEHEVDFLDENLATYNLLVSTGSNKEVVNYCMNKQVEYFVEDVPLGDGGAIRKAMERFQEEDPNDSFLFVMNGDIITTINLKNLVVKGKERLKRNKDLLGIIVVVPFQSHLGIMDCLLNGTNFSQIKSFKEKPIFKEKYSSCGMYLLNNKIIDIIPEKGGFANEVISKHYDKFESWIVSSEEWIAVETKKDMIKAELLVNNNINLK